MNRKRFWSLGLIFVFLSMGSVSAQIQPTSRVLPFSGNMPGQPDGPVALRLRLFPVNAGGAFVFEETQTVNVSAETFSVFIGDATSGGIPSTVFANNASLWIAFAMDATPDTEIGDRTPITSAGYAQYALSLNTAFTDARYASLAAANTFGANQVINGNLGIGTSNLSARLAIRGGARDVLIGDAGCGDFIPGIGFGALTGCANYSIAGDVQNTFVNRQRFGRLSFREANVEQMVIVPDGNVGIGTGGPLGKLHVVTTSDTNPTVITAWGSRHFVVGAPASTGGIGMSYDQANNVGYFEALSPGVAWRNLVLQSGGGNVGIGTANPAARLAVRGNGTDVLIGDTGCGAPTAAIGFGRLSGCNTFAIGANPNNNETVINRPAGGQIAFRENNGPDQMSIRPGGDVTIGRNALQARAMGGWVKAMVLVEQDGGIVRCYNSQATGAAVSTPPCGFSSSHPFRGGYVVDFGFQVNDRFIQATAARVAGSTGGVVAGDLVSFSANTVQVSISYATGTSSGDPTNSRVFIFVF